MATRILAGEFVDMPIWDNMTFEDAETLPYPISDFSHTKTRVRE